MEIDNHNIPEIQDDIHIQEDMILSEDLPIPEELILPEEQIAEEVMIEVTNAELYAEVSAKTNVPEETVKTILNALITHQIAAMGI